MKIYITDLSAYNKGFLVGEWIELPMNGDDLSDKIKEVLRSGEDICNDGEEHEEFFITDYECDYMSIEEYENIENLNQIAEEMENLDDQEKKKINYLMNQCGYSFEDALSNYDDCQIWEDTTMENLAEEFLFEGIFGEELMKVAENNFSFLDIEHIARELNYDYTEYNGDIYRAN